MSRMIDQSRPVFRPLRLVAVVMAAWATGAVSPIVLEMDFDGPGVRAPTSSAGIPQTAPTGYLVEGRYGSPPIIRYVPQPAGSPTAMMRTGPAM